MRDKAFEGVLEHWAQSRKKATGTKKFLAEICGGIELLMRHLVDSASLHVYIYIYNRRERGKDM